MNARKYLQILNCVGGSGVKVEEKKDTKGPTHKQLLMERQKRSAGADGDVGNQAPGFKRYVNVRI